MSLNFPVPRVALIGVSGYGRIHLQLIRECLARGEITLMAAVIINPGEETATIAELRGRGCRIYDDYAAMLAAEAGRIDLCMIPTGIHWHAEMSIAALRSGANVLVEKPLAASAADAAAIAAVEHETGRFVAVGFQDYYESATQWVKERVHAGAIGRLEEVRFLGIWPRPRSYYQRNGWAGRLAADGRPVLDSPLNNAFAHFAMLGLYFAGAGRDEAAGQLEIESAELRHAHQIESFDTAVVRLRAGGVKLWFGVSHSCRPQFEPEIRLIGDGGKASWHYEREVHVAGEVRAMADITGARREMMATVLRRLRDPAVRICSPALAVRHTEFVLALHAAHAVTPFAADQIDWTEAPSAPAATPIVRGLEPALHRAYAAGGSLADAGFTA
ncbi:MAG: Inositol 2-dehydrogenase [Verrucomicrobiota bacterium]|jgi:predicted dehydrogenase